MPYFSGLPGSEWNDNPGATVAARNPISINTGEGYETFGNVGNVGGWDASLAEMRKINPDQTDEFYTDELTRMGLTPANRGGPDMSGVMKGAGLNNWMQVSGRQPGGFAFQLKSGDKEGTIIDYERVGNEWVPKVRGKTMWNTNEGAEMNKLAIMSMLGIAGAGVGAALAPAAGAAAGTGYGLVDGAAVGASGLGNAAWVGGAGAGGAYGGTAGTLDYLKSAYDAYQLGNKAYKGYNTLSGLFGGGEGQVGGAGSQRPGGAGGGSGMADLGFLNNLFNMGGAMYSANKNDNYADEMRRERERSLAERQPFLDRVGALSGDAGAENFRNGGTWQAAERVGANKFTRQAAQAGGLSNDIQRTGQLQDLFMTHLDRERTGARGDLNAFDEKASRDALMKGIEMDRMKNSPLFAGAAYGAGGGQGTLTPQMIQQIMQMPGGLQYLQRITGMTGGSNDQSGAGEFGMGNRNEDFVPGPGQDYSNVSMPSDEIGNGGNDISSWLSDGAWDI